MVFRDSNSAIQKITQTSFIIFLMIAGSACTSRSEKKVAVECAPSQTKGADGSCQGAPTAATTQTPTEFDPATSPEPQGEQQQGEQQDDPSITQNGEQNQSNDEEMDMDQPFTQQQQNQNQQMQQQNQNQQMQQQNQNQQMQQQNQNQQMQQQNQNQNQLQQQSQNDPMNANETVTTLFNNAPNSTADGAPLIALKLVTSQTQGKVARAAFSYNTGVSDATFTYHRKVLTANSSPLNDGALIVDINSLPVSVSFRWDNKTCDTGVVDVGFEEKTANATCK